MKLVNSISHEHDGVRRQNLPSKQWMNSISHQHDGSDGKTAIKTQSMNEPRLVQCHLISDLISCHVMSSVTSCHLVSVMPCRVILSHLQSRLMSRHLMSCHLIVTKIACVAGSCIGKRCQITRAPKPRVKSANNAASYMGYRREH